MVEGSPPDPAPVSDGTEVTPPATTTDVEGAADEVTNSQRTPEEIEAIWKNRIAGKDRAHAAEAATLRQQVEEANRRAAAAEARKQQEEEADMSEADQWKRKAEEAERRAEQVERQRVLDVRNAKYAAAAEHLDESALLAMDEAKLAALDARLRDVDAPPPPLVDPNTPRRSSNASTEPRERSIAEMEEDLKRHAPAFEERLRG